MEQTQTLNTKIQRELGRVLEKSDIEMLEEMRQQCDDNPALEMKEADNNDINTMAEDGSRSETWEEIHRNDYASEEEMPFPRYYASNRSADDEFYTPDVVSEISLADYLLDQLGERDLSQHDSLIAEYIVGNLDSNGYLQRAPWAIADDITFKEFIETETEQVERVMKMVRQLDPPGIAAYNLKECLLLQLERRTGTDAKLAYRIVDECFEHMARKNYERIASALKISVDDVKRVVKKEIVTLNPKPGSAFSGGTSDSHRLQITPDFQVELMGNKLTLTLSNRIPELTISESYDCAMQEMSATPYGDKARNDQRRVIKEQYDKANGFISLLKKRQDTLYRSVKALVNRQLAYFFSGDASQLVPMTLQNIADEVGLDVSVISRATTNKYIDTPWGVKPLKFFFTEGIKKNVNGQETEVSTQQVKMAIKQLVSDEDKKHPMSDDKIKDLLQQMGYEIARRTVSKYREAMGIPAAALRKHVD